MRLKAFGYFIELANVGSFYAASRNLGISQQGLSRAIGALEEELGAVLLERSRRGVHLTERGKVFLGYAKKMLALQDSMMDELRSFGGDGSSSKNRIKVYVSYYSAQIAAMDPDYVKMLSQGSFYVEEPFERLMRRAVSSDGNDLVYLDVHPYSMQKILDNPDVQYVPTLKTQFGILWKEDSKFAGRDLISCSEVADRPIAVNTFREMSYYTEWLFRDCPLQDIRMGTTSSKMLLEYVKSSESAIEIFDSFSYFLAKRFGADSAAGLGFTPFVTSDATCSVGFVFPKKAALSTRAQRSTQLLAGLLRKNCEEYFKEYPLD